MLKRAQNLLLAGLLLLVLPVWAGFDEGIDYKTISPRVPNNIDQQHVEVVELFWYGCPHCYEFEPILDKWLVEKKPMDVNFVRVPAVFNPRWALHARAYYAAEILGVLDKIHKPLFDAMHLQRKKLATVEELARFFAEHGVKQEDFLNAFNSFAVDARVRRATDLTRRYGIDGVPTMIINGKYQASSTLAGGSRQRMMQIVDYLIEKEVKQLGKN